MMQKTFFTTLGIALMIHWANSAASECLNELPDGIPKRCKAKDVCPFLARKGKCNKQWKDLEPIYHPIRDKYCTFSELDGVTRMMKVRKFCEKSCKVCVDGNWSSWGQWSTCSKPCGWGKKKRKRTCTNPKPHGLGKKCGGRSKNVKVCSKQPMCNCGTRLNRVGEFVVDPYSLPWHVGLVRNGTNFPTCSGTVIGPQHVLTAAHCVTEDQIDFDVIVGGRTNNDTTMGSIHKVCGIITHPYYKGIDLDHDFDYDFAIIQLKSSVTFGSRAAPACLPLGRFKGEKLAGQHATAIGWERKPEGGEGLIALNQNATMSFWERPTKGEEKVSALNSEVVPILTNEECNADFYNATDSITYKTRPITNSMICAEQPLARVDTCRRDSGGGPLTYDYNDKTYVVGVLSYGLGCGKSELPSVYSRVSQVRGWISQQMRKTCQTDEENGIAL